MGSISNPDQTSAIRISHSNLGTRGEKEKDKDEYAKEEQGISLRKFGWQKSLLITVATLVGVCMTGLLVGMGKKFVCGNSQPEKIIFNDIECVDIDRNPPGFLSLKKKKANENDMKTCSLPKGNDSKLNICNVIDQVHELILAVIPRSLQKITTKFNSNEVRPKNSISLSEESDIKKQNIHFFQRIGNFFKRGNKKNKQKNTTQKNASTTYSDKYTDVQVKQAQQLASYIRAKTNLSDSVFDTRMNNVAWGGPGSEGRPWWNKNRKGKKGIDGDGVKLMLSYLKIMKFPKDKVTKFPFDLCQKGCSTDFALLHTLEWREKFKPWQMTPTAIKENKDGWTYVHGSSPGVGDEPGPTVIYWRPGLHVVKNEEGYLRALINGLELAVADSLRRSDNKTGKYNVLIDTTNFKIANVGGVNQVKRAFRVLKDHFPDRLSHVFMTNLGGPAQIFLKILTQFIDKDVRDKFHIVPNDPQATVEALRPFLGDSIPTWLGGNDAFSFSTETYYNSMPKSMFTTDEEGLRYLESLPYHGP